MVINNFIYGSGVGGVYPVLAAETSSVKLRAKTLSIGFVVNAFFSWLFNFVVPYMFNTDEGNLGESLINCPTGLVWWNAAY